MNSKGQGALEYLILIGGAVLVAVIIIAIVNGANSPDRFDSAAFNFCQAWTEERGENITHLRGQYLIQLSGCVVECEYSFDVEVFDGGVSSGKREYKYFNISEDDLLEWENKGELKDCCEVCE